MKKLSFNQSWYLVALVLLTVVMTVSAQAADKLVVKDAGGTNTVFRVEDTGNVSVMKGALTVQQNAAEASNTLKLRLTDTNGVDKIAFSPDGVLNVASGDLSALMQLTISTEQAGQGPTFIGRHSHGTLSAPTATQIGDNLFTLSGLGYQGVSGAGGSWLYASTAIFMPARETFTSTAKGADIAFLTTAPGTVSRSEKFRVTGEGNVGIGTSIPTKLLDVNSDGIRIRTAKTPASSAAACNQGDMSWDANFVYVCITTNNWKRSALNSW